MRLLAVDGAGVPRVGVRVDDEVVDLGIAAPELPNTMLHLIAAGPEALERARSAAARAGSEARLALSQITYRIPVERPDKIISIGPNYMKHLREMRPDFQEPPYPAIDRKSVV